MKTANTTSAKVTPSVISPAFGWWTFPTSDPTSKRTSKPPTTGKTAKVARLFSHAAGGSLRVAEVHTIAATPKSAAGAGPSNVIASTNAMKAVVICCPRRVMLNR